MGFLGATMQGQSSKTKSSVERCKILAVDDDPTSLIIVSTMLRAWQYEVVTVKSPVDALATVRTQKDEIDLVLTDLHMPEMSGLELQQQINAEFKLPVIIISSDDRETMILKCLKSGAVFYIIKPISQNDLKNVWQHAVQHKEGKSILIERVGSVQGRSSSSSREKTSYYADDVASAASVNEDNCGSKKKYCKRKYYKKSKEYLQGDNSNFAPKRAKVVWTNSLHNRFLQAIKHITLEKAVPKKILECMNVPGLTRENVASHLQKHRIFLRKVGEKGASAASKKFCSRNLGQSSLLLKNSENKGNKQIGTSSQPTYGNTYMSSLNLCNFGARHGVSSSNSVSPLGLLGNQANIRQTFSSYTNPLYQANRTSFGMGSNDYINTNWLLSGGMSRGPVSDSSPMQMHQQQSSASWFGLYNTLNPYSNYAGLRLADDGELFGTGQTRLNGNGIHGGNGLTDGAQNNNMSTVEARVIPAFGYWAPGESSYSRFDHANYCQYPPAFGSVNEKGKHSVQLPPQPQQQYGGLSNGGQNDFADFNLMSNVFGKSAHPKPSGEGDISGYLFGPTNYQFRYQQRGGEGVLMNPNLPSSSYHAEVSSPSNLSLNLFATGTVEENDPWIADQPSLEQLQDIEEAVNGELDNDKNVFNDYNPSFDPNPNDQQEGDDADIQTLRSIT